MLSRLRPFRRLAIAEADAARGVAKADEALSDYGVLHDRTVRMVKILNSYAPCYNCGVLAHVKRITMFEIGKPNGEPGTMHVAACQWCKSRMRQRAVRCVQGQSVVDVKPDRERAEGQL